MANNVTTHITFENLSPKAKDFLASLSEKRKEDEYCYMIPLYGMDVNDEKANYDWFCENIGPKWMYLEDVDMDIGYMNCVSAWSAPVPFMDRLYEYLVSLDSPDLILWATIEDEMPNFVGVYGRHGEDSYQDEIVEDFYQEEIGDVPFIADGEDDFEFNDNWPEAVSTWSDNHYSLFLNEIKTNG